MVERGPWGSESEMLGGGEPVAHSRHVSAGAPSRWTWHRRVHTYWEFLQHVVVREVTCDSKSPYGALPGSVKAAFSPRAGPPSIRP